MADSGKGHHVADPEGSWVSKPDVPGMTSFTSYEGLALDDQNKVDWESPEDPANPRNWSKATQLTHLLLVSSFTLYANLAATMFAPGAQSLADDFGVENGTVEALAVSIYVLGFALGPLLLAPLSEVYGRLNIYHITNAVYVGFTIGCALSTGIAMFLVFRLICGCAASASLTIGGGTVADLVASDKRGGAMALFGIGPILGPVIGPIIGGFVTANIGWRWTFWLIVIMSSVLSLLGLVFLRETNEAILLNRKAARLREETGNTKLYLRTASKLTPRQTVIRAVLRPTKMLIFSPIVLLFSLYTAFVFGLIFLLFATFPTVFETNYGFSTQMSGLAYLGLGIGMFLGIIIFRRLSDRVSKGKEEKSGESRPEMRLLLMVWFSPVTPIGFFWYGWSAEEQTHWIVPILGTFLIGFGAFFIILATQIYFVDTFGPEAAASALAANTVVRNLFGAFIPLAASSLYDKLGLGWGNSVLGFICLAFVPIPSLFLRYGARLRKRFPINIS